MLSKVYRLQLLFSYQCLLLCSMVHIFKQQLLRIRGNGDFFFSGKPLLWNGTKIFIIGLVFCENLRDHVKNNLHS